MDGREQEGDNEPEQRAPLLHPGEKAAGLPKLGVRDDVGDDRVVRGGGPVEEQLRDDVADHELRVAVSGHHHHEAYDAEEHAGDHERPPPAEPRRDPVRPGAHDRRHRDRKDGADPRRVADERVEVGGIELPDFAGQDDQDAGHAGHADGTDAQRAVADRDREAALAHLVDGLLEGEVAVEHDVGDSHVDAGALDPEVRPSRQPGLGSVVEGRRGCLGVQQHGEGAADADRPEVQGGAEFELAREAAVADHERAAEIEGRKTLTEGPGGGLNVADKLKNAKVDENEVNRIVAIIDSMTRKERANHMIINGARRRRIAKGSGTSVQEVNSLLKQYAQARKMMKSITGGGFLGKRLGKMKLPPGLFGGMGQ